MARTEAVIVDAVRTPIGRYGGVLQEVRPDDLGAAAIRALIERTHLDPSKVEDVIWGCANQAGEDNRNVGRMSALLAGLPFSVPGTTVNRLCGSSLDAVQHAVRAIWSGDAEIIIAGGVESMSRAPYSMAKNLSGDRKSTRLNSSHLVISYAVFCLKKKKNNIIWYILDT